MLTTACKYVSIAGPMGAGPLFHPHFAAEVTFSGSILALGCFVYVLKLGDLDGCLREVGGDF